MSTKAQDLTNRRFGRLTPLYIEKVYNKCTFWMCRCDCGKIKSIRKDALMKGKTVSCGCYCQEIHFKGYKDISGEYWAAVKRGASSRALEFNITLEQVWNLFIKQNGKCALTGRPLVLARNYSKGAIDQTASLDRIDSSKGYTIDNVCWLHKDINMFKAAMHSEDFIKLCYEVVNYQQVLGAKHGNDT